MTEHRTVRAGAIAATLAEGQLRDVRVHGGEVLRRLAVVVRDTGWGTVPPSLEHVAVTESGPEACVEVTARCRAGALDVRWSARYVLGPRDELRADVRLEPLADFPYNRMGLVVLHPPDIAGAACASTGPAGSRRGRLPVLVGPQRFTAGHLRPLFPPFQELRIALAAGLETRLLFSGDLFEMEDQRNWTDGSFKSYSTPLELGVPHRARAGDAVEQRLRARLRRRSPAIRPAETGSLVLGGPVGRMPEVGLLAGAATPAPEARGLLRALAPAHLRVDVRAPEDIPRARRLAAGLGAPLEVAVHGRTGGPDDVRVLLDQLGRERLPVARVLLHADDGDVTPEEMLAAACAILPPHVAVGGGSDRHFAELNRGRPSLDGASCVAFPMSPQVHADDDDTLIESLAGQRAALATAAAVWPGRDLVVSPLTLRPRSGPGAGPPDPRQATPFAAAWLTASLAGLAVHGARAVTALEASGPRGAVDGAGLATPAFHVLADAAALRGGRVLETEHGVPGLHALAVQHGRRLTLLLANLGRTALRVEPPAAEQGWTCRLLDGGSAEAAARDPLRFRATSHALRADSLRLDPHASARLEQAVAEEP